MSPGCWPTPRCDRLTTSWRPNRRSRAVIRARTTAGLTQAQLAERMGTSQSYIARLESGRTLPSTRTLLKVAEATGARPRFTLEVAA